MWRGASGRAGNGSEHEGWRIVVALAAQTAHNDIMRFGFLAGGVVLASFLAGYSSSCDSARDRGFTEIPANVSVKPAPHEARTIESSTTTRSGSAPDLLAAMRPSVDSIRQGGRILSAIDALDASAMAALFTPPRSVEFQQRLDELREKMGLAVKP